MSYRDKMATQSQRKGNTPKDTGRKRKRRINRNRKHENNLCEKVYAPQESLFSSNENNYQFGYLWRPTVLYFSDYHEIETTMWEFLVASYSFEYFIPNDIFDALAIPNSYRKDRIPKMIKKGLIKVYIQGNKQLNELTTYKITRKGKLEVSRFYRIILSQEEFPRYY